jgi:hypothetical protein
MVILHRELDVNNTDDLIASLDSAKTLEDLSPFI